MTLRKVRFIRVASRQRDVSNDAKSRRQEALPYTNTGQPDHLKPPSFAGVEVDAAIHGLRGSVDSIRLTKTEWRSLAA